MNIEEEKQKEIDSLDCENPENILYFSDPIFLVNEAPLAVHLARAEEYDVPLVVILTNKMFEIRKMIEDDTSMTVTSLSFTHAVCVVDDKAIEKHDHWKKMIANGKNPKNYITIVLWHKSENQIMIKQIGEEMGPFQTNVPLKYINAPCEIANEEWRTKVRNCHAENKGKNSLLKTLKVGDRFTVYGKLYEFRYLYKNNQCIALNLEENKTYRVKASQIKI